MRNMGSHVKYRCVSIEYQVRCWHRSRGSSCIRSMWNLSLLLYVSICWPQIVALSYVLFLYRSFQLIQVRQPCQHHLLVRLLDFAG
jgi:hypothetical protein